MAEVAEQIFGRQTVTRGRALQRSGAVLDIWGDPDSSVSALVQGTQSSPYAVEFWLDKDGGFEFGECSCPVGYNCKHVVAATLEYWNDTSADDHAPVMSSRSAHIASASRDETEVSEWWSRLCASLIEDSGVSQKPSHTTAQHGPSTRDRIYSLSPSISTPQNGIVAGVTLTLLDASRTAAGHYHKGRRANPDRAYLGFDTQLLSIDKDIEALGVAQLTQVHGRWASDSGRYNLVGRTGQSLLELALSSGRCFIDKERRTPATLGDRRALQFVWKTVDDESMRLTAELDGLSNWWAVASNPPYWIDPRTFTVGVIDTSLDAEQFLLMLEAPSVPAAELQSIAEELAQFRNVDLPDSQQARSVIPMPPVQLLPLIDVPAVPVMILRSIDDNPHVDSWRLFLCMRYGSAVLPCSYNEHDPITRTCDEDGQVVRVKRDLGTETVCFFELMRRVPGLLPQLEESSNLPSSVFSASGDSPADRFTQYRTLVRQRDAFESDGWTLIVLPPVHTETIRPERFDGLVQRVDNGPGWFDVSLGFQINGVRHDLLELVADYIERGGGDEPLLVETDEGGFIEVPAEVLRPVAQTFLELGDPLEGDGDGNKIRLSRARALALEGLDAALGIDGCEMRWNGIREPFALAQQLRAFAQTDIASLKQVTVPRGLQAVLRPYQRTGLAWLNTLAKHDLCGILADDMGLGKTLQTLAHVLWLRQSRRLNGPVLVIVPTSLLVNWAREVRRFTPRLHVRIWHGPERGQLPLNVESPPANLVITSYGLALRDHELLAEHGFDFLVLDEAQHIRNPRAKTTRAIKALPITRRLCLSGTPLENHLGELWSQFDFLMPGLLGDDQHFTRKFRTPIERYGDSDCQQRLANVVAPFLLRRHKEDVATELPPKTEILREVKLGDAQAKLYESIRISMKKRVRDALDARGLARSQVTVLDALLKLRQLCCHPHLLKMNSARRLGESAKTALALDMIDELVAEGRRILVFSSFTSMLSLLEQELGKRGHRWVKLTGQTRKRDQVIDRFQQGDVPLFLISLKAGGTGLNLTAADTVILYDPWWNPAAEDQASARTHRIGQDKPVFVYRLVTTDTVEQRIIAMQDRKRELAQATLEGGDRGTLGRMSVDETLALFDS